MEQNQNPTLNPSPSQGRETPLIVWKNAGETLDQLLDRVRSASLADKLGYNISPETKITYAGRLDPLASGIMILLVGDGVHDKELYNKLDKRYRATVVLGFETDTYDVLGIPSPSPSQGSNLGLEYLIKNILEKQIGTHTQTYPPYSSKNVNGVPLWKLTRDGNLPDVLPSREVVVYGANLVIPAPEPESRVLSHIPLDPLTLVRDDTCGVLISGVDLLLKIRETVSRVTGDFRQAEILDSWEKNIVSRETYQILEIDYHVGSGTYIRGLVHELGQQLGIGAVLLALERYQAGDYTHTSITKHN